MTEPNRLPLRVLVKGASRSDLDISRVIETELQAAGCPAEVRCTATPAERTKVALRTWQEEVLPWSPDVVILGYGETEAIQRLRSGARRVIADLERVIELVRTVASPLVLIPEISPAGAPDRRSSRGTEARIEAMNGALHDLVARIDQEDVRIIPTPEDIADVILEWAEQQTHLDLEAVQARRATRLRGRLAPTAD